jgi:hypothetical protein
MTTATAAATNRLILCSGPYRYYGAKTLDANPDYQPDYCAVLPPLPRELRQGQWDEIYLFHGIEHFYVWEVPELLSQIHEALAVDGTLIMEQPNVEVAAKVMLGVLPPMTEKPEASGVNAIYGDPAHQNPWMTHKWGWTPETLRDACVTAGFSVVKAGRALSRPFAEGRDFRIEATK